MAVKRYARFMSEAKKGGDFAYCTAPDIRTIIQTSLTDGEITGIFEMSEAQIDRRTGARDSNNKLVKKLSILLTDHAIKTRQPMSQAIGDYREVDDVPEVWEREIERIYRLYKGVSVKASEYRHIDKSKRYAEG
jgi:hypothetical protein